MNWPDDWVHIHVGGYDVHGAPYEYLRGLLRVVSLWEDETLRNEAFDELARLMAPGQYDAATYQARAEGLFVATAYATIGLSEKGARRFCVDTLIALVP